MTKKTYGQKQSADSQDSSATWLPAADAALGPLTISLTAGYPQPDYTTGFVTASSSGNPLEDKWFLSTANSMMNEMSCSISATSTTKKNNDSLSESQRTDPG